MCSSTSLPQTVPPPSPSQASKCKLAQPAAPVTMAAGKAAQSSKDDWADQWQRIMNNTPDYAYELQSPMLTRLRQTQSGLSRTNSLPTTEGSISRPTPIGLMSTPEAYSSQPAAPAFDPHSNQFAVRALTHEPSLQQSASSSSGGPDRQGSVAEPDADSVGPRPDPTFPQSTPGETDAWTFLHQRQPTADGELDQLEHTQKAGSQFRRISSSIGSQSGHYNPASAIINRIEHLNERGMKAIIVSPAACGTRQPDVPCSRRVTVLHMVWDMLEACPCNIWCHKLRAWCDGDGVTGTSPQRACAGLRLTSAPLCSSPSSWASGWQSPCCWCWWSPAATMPGARTCVTTPCGRSTLLWGSSASLCWAPTGASW